MSTDEKPKVSPDIDTIVSAPNQIVFLDGTPALVKRLKTREMMALLKILTRGAATTLVDFAGEADSDDFASTLIAAVIMAIPEAENETVEFVQRMVEPMGLVEGSRLSKNEREINADVLDHLKELLTNPELEDLFTVVTKVIEIEAPHIQSLGKSLAVLWKVQRTAAESRRIASSESD